MSDLTRRILLESNADILREVECLITLVEGLTPPPELSVYRQAVQQRCQKLQREIEHNLAEIKTKPASAFRILLSETQRLKRDLLVYSHRLIGPLRRHVSEDRLPLRVLQWLYNTHAVTRPIPVGLINGEFQVWPEVDEPTVYGLPVSMQQGLLYLPLLFHEFGHQLFTYHWAEIYRFISDLQKEIEIFLTPRTLGRDAAAERDRRRRKDIVGTWYTWCEELFCDAIGLTIGGPAFLYALDRYVRIVNEKEYHATSSELTNRYHPIFRLRMRLLVHRARELGCGPVADQVEQTWQTLATLLQVEEDYYGFYEEEYFPFIQTTLKKMIQEVGPYRFTATDLSPDPWAPPSTPVHLLNQAWTHFITTPETYSAWERQMIGRFCA